MCASPELATSALSKLSYVLRRLRLRLRRIPRSNTHGITSEGIRAAVFYTSFENRLLRPPLYADRPPKIEIHRVLEALDHAVTVYIQHARLTPA